MDRRLVGVGAAVLGVVLVGAGVGSAFMMSQPSASTGASVDLDVARAAGRSAGGPNDSAVAPGPAAGSSGPSAAGLVPSGAAPGVADGGGVDGVGGSEAILAMEEAVADLAVDGAKVENIGKRCSPAPCVMAVRITGGPEALEAGRQALFVASRETVDPEEGQPSFTWREGPGVLLGFMFVVPNDLTPEAGPAFEAGWRVNVKELGGGF
jgi:hypothetical protein